MKEYYTIEDIVKMDAKQSIREAMKEWGIERTEELIKKHYGDNPKALKFMLDCYKEIIHLGIVVFLGVDVIKNGLLK